MRNRTLAWLIPAVVLIALGSAAPTAAETNINFFLGGKSLAGSDWIPGDEQGEIGVMTTFGPKDWPVQIALDLLGSSSNEETFRLTTPGVDIRGPALVQATAEFDVGVRKIWQKGKKVRPFVGGGLAFIFAQQERAVDLDEPLTFDDLLLPVAVRTEDDSAVGLWVGGGAFWRLTKRFNLGLEARFSSAEVELFHREVQAGGFHLGMLLGFGF